VVKALPLKVKAPISLLRILWPIDTVAKMRGRNFINERSKKTFAVLLPFTRTPPILKRLMMAYDGEKKENLGYQPRLAVSTLG
jgi:hypothetical protein